MKTRHLEMILQGECPHDFVAEIRRDWDVVHDATSYYVSIWSPKLGISVQKVTQSRDEVLELGREAIAELLTNRRE